jgi:NAD(P)-dependent dehydrogenase (short-subunit alcohol dehydrogenase family)
MSDIAYATYPSLAGRTVFVSGGASGIGEAIVRAFAGQRAKVGFVDILEAEGTKLAGELRDAGATVYFLPADLTDISALQDAVLGISEALGTITVLVNNAANDMRHDWQGETSESWDARIAVNLKHQFFAIQAVAPGMIEAGGGSIVNFGSISWRIGLGGMPAYTASKAAVEALTRSFARDLGRHRIRVNTVLPGWVMTKRQLELWVDESTDRVLEERQSLPGRLVPDDLARMVLFLAADDSAMCSSQNFIVDGGWV